MAIPLHVFREYDIRGLVATELTPEFAERLGRGFGQYLLEKDPDDATRSGGDGTSTTRT
jgi:phosphomannomutase